MHWTQFDGTYPPGYILPANTEPQRGPRGQFTPVNCGTRHGRHAVVHWMNGVAVGADEVRLPVGRKRGRVRRDGHRTNTWLRPLNDERRAFDRDFMRVPIRWQRGHLEITHRDVTFVDSAPRPAPNYAEDPDAPFLKQDLSEHPEIRRIALELEGAIALRVLLQDQFVRVSDGLEQQLTGSDDCAAFVAEARGLNETVQDLKLADLGPVDADRRDALSDALLDVMAGTGWVLKPIDAKLLSELEELRVKAEKVAAGPDARRADNASGWLELLQSTLHRWRRRG